MKRSADSYSVGDVVWFADRRRWKRGVVLGHCGGALELREYVIDATDQARVCSRPAELVRPWASDGKEPRELAPSLLEVQP